MSSDTKLNTPAIRKPAPRRVWQPPQAKTVKVVDITRSTLTGSGYDGAMCNS